MQDKCNIIENKVNVYLGHSSAAAEISCLKLSWPDNFVTHYSAQCSEVDLSKMNAMLLTINVNV